MRYGCRLLAAPVMELPCHPAGDVCVRACVCVRVHVCVSWLHDHRHQMFFYRHLIRCVSPSVSFCSVQCVCVCVFHKTRRRRVCCVNSRLSDWAEGISAERPWLVGPSRGSSNHMISQCSAITLLIIAQEVVAAFLIKRAASTRLNVLLLDFPDTETHQNFFWIHFFVFYSFLFLFCGFWLKYQRFSQRHL